MGKTSIEWSDHSINPIRARNIETGQVGHYCEKISPGCTNCYASRLQPRFGTFPFLAENRQKVELFLDTSKLEEVLRRRKPTKYFWCDMSDMFLEDHKDEWIEQCFATMALTPWHTHQVLTKRPKRMLEYLSSDETQVSAWMAEDFLLQRLDGKATMGTSWPLPNVWLGVSVEDCERKSRIDLLRETPAAVRFLSLEPLLKDLGKLDLRGIHWVIVGGESGPGARPTHPDWVRSIRDQCEAAGVAFFFKQWGEWIPSGYGDVSHLVEGHSIKPRSIGPERLRWLYPDGTSDICGMGDANRGHLVTCVGKRNADRKIDGREWNQFPAVANA